MRTTQKKMTRRSPSYSPSPRCAEEGSESIWESWPSFFREGIEANLATSPNLRRKYLDNQRRHSARMLDGKPSTPLEFVDENTRLVNGVEEEKCTLFQATFNGINVLLGVGILSLPFALRSSGFLIGIPLLLFLSAVTNHTGKLLGECIEYEAGMKTYPDIGEAAFGSRGRFFISCVFFLELFTACTMFLILVGDNLHELVPSFSETQLMLLAFLVILPTTWTPQLTILSYFSIIGILSSFYLMVVLLYAGFSNPFDAETGGSALHPEKTEWLADADRLPLSIGLTMVGFAGHAVFPSIYYSMSDRKFYPRMLDITYLIAVSVYAAIGIVGYLMYGVATSKEVTLNLMQSNPGWITTSVICMIALNPATKFALTMNPVALSLEELVLTPRLMIENSWRSSISRAIIRTILSSVCLICAMYMPYFARVTSFLGSLSAMLVSAIFPCACYLKLYSHRLTTTQCVVNIAIVLISIVLAVIGTIAAFFAPAS